MHLTPAQVAINVFGTPMQLSRAIGASPAAPFRWMAPRRGRSSAGDIPVPQIRRILEVAKERRLAISLDDLIYGREVAEPSAPVAEAATVGA